MVVRHDAESAARALRQLDDVASTEVTNSVEYSAHVVLKALTHGKHVMLMNAEFDATPAVPLPRLTPSHMGSFSPTAKAMNLRCR
jgi:predicted homoserine dehydrogenase-like protein